jgi:hypothetical protein
VRQELFSKYISPEKLFRVIVLICFMGMGFSAIYMTSHAGSMETTYAYAHDLASYFFTATWIFVFFYAQYRVVPHFTHRDLDRRIGLWHAFGSFALLVLGVLTVVLLPTRSDVPSSLLFWATLLGEGTFIGNLIWSYVQGDQDVPLLPVVQATKPPPARVPEASARNIGWPKSPAKLFAIGAAFFAAGGVISLILNVPAFRFLVSWYGELHSIPYGYLWMAAAAPFTVFALFYKFLTDVQDLHFEDSLNRLHFLVTVIAVVDLVRVFGAWQQTLVSKMAALYFGPEFQWLAVLFSLSALLFGLNAYRSYRKGIVRA